MYKHFQGLNILLSKATDERDATPIAVLSAIMSPGGYLNLKRVATFSFRISRRYGYVAKAMISFSYRAAS